MLKSRGKQQWHNRTQPVFVAVLVGLGATTDAAATAAGRCIRTAALTLPTRVRHSPAQREAYARVASSGHPHALHVVR